MRVRGEDGKWHKEEVGEGIGTLSLEAGKEPLKGIERELRVVRVGPNPRVVQCEYMELATRRTCVVKVGDNRKWMRGMRFFMEEPRDEEAYVRPWVYRGKAPRRRGRW